MSLYEFLESQAKAALTGLGVGADGNLVNEVAQLIGGDEHDGLTRLIAKFQAQGLEAAVASWVGVRANEPVSPEQLQSVLGPEKIAAVAQRLGVSPADASRALAKMLPQLIDSLTPDGQLPSETKLQQTLSSLLSRG